MLGVSSGTVKNVYREMASGGQLRLQKGIGTFWISGGEQSAAPARPQSQSLRIGICTDTPINSPSIQRGWGGPILGGILKHHLACRRSLALERVGRAGLCLDEKEREQLTELDGVIVLYLIPNLPPLIDANGREVPLVSLNPPTFTGTKNFVAPDYFSCSRVLGEVWRKTGRRRVAYLSTNNLESSVSSNHRFGGLGCGVAIGLGSEIELRLVSTQGNGSVEGGRGAVDAFLDEGWLPDGIYCGGDILARGVFSRLRERGISVPDEVSVVGGSQSKGASFEPLTNMVHPLERVGEQLLAMLLRRIDEKCDQPACYEPVPFGIGLSTRPCENELLAAYSRNIA